jgi:hypothetical protein
MKTARGVWNTVSRANPGKFPVKNPFEKMGLQSTSRETPFATFAELQVFRAKAVETGFQSIATGALIGWEFLQREHHIYTAFKAEHYRPVHTRACARCESKNQPWRLDAALQ